MPYWVSILAWLGQALIIDPAAAPPIQPIQSVAWKLSHTTSIDAGQSIMATADLSQSDVAFAGMMIRCAKDKATLIVVATTPFSPKAQVSVTLRGTSESHYVGSIRAGGVAIELPEAALTEAIATWPTQRKISVELETDSQRIRGVIDVIGFTSAYEALRSSCR